MRRKYLDLSVFLVLLFLCIYHLGLDYWNSKWAMLAILACVYVGALACVRVRSAGAGALLAWAMLSSVYVTLISPSFYRDNLISVMIKMGYSAEHLHPTVVFRGFESYSYQTMVMLMLIAFVVLTLRKETATAIQRAFGYLGLISSTWVIAKSFDPASDALITGIFFDQGTAEGIFIAVCYPLLLRSKSIFKPQSRLYLLDAFLSTLCPPIACILLTTHWTVSQPILIIAGAMALDLICVPWSVWWRGVEIKPTLLKKVAFASLVLAVAVAIGAHFNDVFFSTSGRFEVYRRALKFQHEMGAFWWGLGTGTWAPWIYYIQKAEDFSANGIFVWMHSDWLQVLFEQGIIGLGLIVWVGLVAFVRAVRSNADRHLATALAAFGAGMIFNYPSHLAVSAFLGMFLLVMCLRSQD